MNSGFSHKMEEEKGKRGKKILISAPNEMNPGHAAKKPLEWEMEY